MVLTLNGVSYYCYISIMVSYDLQFRRGIVSSTLSMFKIPLGTERQHFVIMKDFLKSVRKDAMFNREIKRWGRVETFLFLVSKLVERVLSHYSYSAKTRRLKKFRVIKDGIAYFDFNGAKMPDVTVSKEKLWVLEYIFEDIFLISCYHNDNYEKDFVKSIDKILLEGPYGYVDGKFDVTVHKGDCVIDAGAWIGDFSAYAASKGAIAYAFEPSEDTFGWLKKTAELNNGVGRIVPIQKGLGDKVEVLSISTNENNSGANSLAKEGESSERVEITTLDIFVREYNLERVDFIKSDIEGFERNLLTGARETLKKFAPKLAICTYHYPEDPSLLAHIIKEANPNYTIVQLRHKLFAAVV